MPLSDIVNVVITRQTQTITEQGFGVPLILGASVRFEDLIKFYSDMDGVALDFEPTDPEYIAAQDIFSQTISPNLIAIGRRQVDDVDIQVVTSMSGEDYILDIDGNPLATSSTSTTTYSVVTLNGDLVPGNVITSSVNGSPVNITTLVDFNADFVTGNSIVPTVNGVPLTAVPYNVGGQADTIADVATRIASAAGVTSATVTGARQITVIFASPINNVVNSVVTTGGASQPTATMTQSGILYDSNFLTTMELIASVYEQLPNIDSAQVNPTNTRILTVQGPPNTTAVVNSFTVTGGASQPVATITNPLQPVSVESIAGDIVANVNAQILIDPTFPVTATDNGDGTFTLENRVPGTPWTLRASTTIGSPNRAVARITQVMPNTEYTVTLNNVDFTYRSPVNVQTANEIVAELVDLINDPASNVPVDATNLNDGSFTIQSTNLINTFSISVSPDIMSYDKGLKILPLVAVNPAATDLTAINNANNSWYALISTSRDVNDVLAIAEWVEARIKLFGTASADTVIINSQPGADTTSIAARLGQLGYVRSFVMYHQDAAYDYPEAAWFGRVLPLEPGSETWKFKTLNGISYSNLTTTQSMNALGKKANTYEFVGGVGITANGTVAQGEYIDIIRGVDWLTARIQEFVFRVLVNNPKVPYTDAGIASIQAEVLRVLQLGISNDFIASDPEPTCTVPRAADVPPADKAARILRNVKFQATLAGAIHAVQIRGTVSV